MKNKNMIILLLIMMLLMGCNSQPVKPSPVPDFINEIKIASFTFQPNTIEVTRGTTMEWTNLDDAHTVTSVDGKFDSGSMEKGGTFSHTFNEAGIFEYQCKLHPSMKHGFVIVE